MPEITPGLIAFRRSSRLIVIHSAGPRIAVRISVPAIVVMPGSVGLRQAELALGDEAKDHFARDRRELHRHHFAEITLDVILGSVAHSTMGANGAVTGPEAGVGGEIF